MIDLKSLIRTIPHFPKEGIMFRDVTTLMKDGPGFKELIRQFAERYKDKNLTAICGVESRGFILGAPLAYELGIGFVPIRKKGKLPAAVYTREITLEYGTDVLELHKDALSDQDHVLIIDDLMATGGTALGAIDLVKEAGAGIEEICVAIDLPELGGSQKIREMGYSVFDLIEFDGH